MPYNLYWGDLHGHCSISYGHGTVEQALMRAREQLDFCSITGHAFWPDMPADRAVYGEIIDYHNEGFGRCARNWPKLLAKLQAGSQEGRFVAFPSYEWHSLASGDHNVYGPGPDLPLEDAPDLRALREMARRNGAIIVPHHIGYAAGYRGIDWKQFDARLSPVVEIFSLHGCSESDAAPYPMLHDMGGRDAGSTAETGWAMGHRFGIIGSTDHHGAYPGSHGDGRAAVFAGALTRRDIWEAILARRVYAATGDRIDARMFVNDAWIGSVIRSPGPRRIRVQVAASDAIDRVEVLRNGRVLRRLFAGPDRSLAGRYRLRITWGWGRKTEVVRWNARLTLADGNIDVVETCFSGAPVVAPQQRAGDEEIPDDQDLPHQLTERGPRSCAWRSSTIGNPTMKHPTTQAISLELAAPLETMLAIEVNGRRIVHPLGELLHAGRCHYMRGWLSEMIRVGPLVPLEECRLTAEFADERPELDTDVYRLRVAQVNGQWAWLTPVWAER